VLFVDWRVMYTALEDSFMLFLLWFHGELMLEFRVIDSLLIKSGGSLLLSRKASRESHFVSRLVPKASAPVHTQCIFALIFLKIR
jgi:hypothetical protein